MNFVATNCAGGCFAARIYQELCNLSGMSTVKVQYFLCEFVRLLSFTIGIHGVAKPVDLVFYWRRMVGSGIHWGFGFLFILFYFLFFSFFFFCWSCVGTGMVSALGMLRSAKRAP